MSSQEPKPLIPALVGLFTILGIAIISDHILWQLRRQARLSPELNPLVIGIQIFTALLLGIALAMVAWYLYTKFLRASQFAWLYIAVGLLVLVFPAFYYSQNVLIQSLLGWILGYLGQYHWIGSWLYGSSGNITGIGMVWLLMGRRSGIGSSLS